MINPEEYPIQVWPDPIPEESMGALRGFRKDEFDEAAHFAMENNPTILIVYSPQGGEIEIKSCDIEIA